MSIERFHTNDRMSQMVIHGDTVYLAVSYTHLTLPTISCV